MRPCVRRHAIVHLSGIQEHENVVKTKQTKIQNNKLNTGTNSAQLTKNHIKSKSQLVCAQSEQKPQQNKELMRLFPNTNP